MSNTRRSNQFNLVRFDSEDDEDSADEDISSEIVAADIARKRTRPINKAVIDESSSESDGNDFR